MYFSGKNKKAPRFCLGALNLFFAERTGFEPANRFCRLHAFQACLFNHSSTSPKRLCSHKFAFAAAKVRKNMRITKNNLCFLITEHQTIAKLIDDDRL